MTKKNVSTNELVTRLASSFDGLTKKVIKELVVQLFSDVETMLVQGNKIRLDKIGILQVKDRAARMGRNPQTGEEIKIPASKKISFRVAKSLKERVSIAKKTVAKKK